MKLFPSKKQWANWSLPSKITYISFMLTMFSIILALIMPYYSNIYIKESDQPKLSITLKNKPYLRYEIKDNGVELSYELCIRNEGKNTAENINYSLYKQKLYVDSKEVSDVNTSILIFNLPEKLITQNDYYQIFKAKNNNLTDAQIEKVINDYESGKLAIILEIEIDYIDSITSKKYKTNETLKISKTQVLIL